MHAHVYEHFRPNMDFLTNNAIFVHIFNGFFLSWD